jgi:uncharacterized membrane protein
MSRLDSLRRSRGGRLTVAIGAVIAAALVALTATTAGPRATAASDDAPTSAGAQLSLVSSATASERHEPSPGGFLYHQRPSGRADFDRLRGVPDTFSTAHLLVNNHGQVAGVLTENDANRTSRGFIQDRRGNTVSFAVPDSLLTLAEGLNDLGQVAGAYVDADAAILPSGNAPPGSVHGYVRDRDGDIDTFDVPFWRLHAAMDINNRGQIVGYYDEPDFAGGGSFLRDRDGTITTINYPGALFTQADAINDRGQVVGAYLEPGAAPNSDGTIARDTVHGFVWERGRFTSFDVPGSVFTHAYGINNRGQISGGYYDTSGRQHGFVRDGRRYRTLDVPGGGGNIAWGINDHGQVVLPDSRAAGLLPLAP